VQLRYCGRSNRSFDVVCSRSGLPSALSLRRAHARHLPTRPCVAPVSKARAAGLRGHRRAASTPMRALFGGSAFADSQPPAASVLPAARTGPSVICLPSTLFLMVRRGRNAREHLFWQIEPIALNKSKHRIPWYNVGSHFICEDLGRSFPHALECPKRLNLEFSRGDDSPPLCKRRQYRRHVRITGGV
jgi:hypothetical protein